MNNQNERKEEMHEETITFSKRVEKMNEMYQLAINEKPTLPAKPADRLEKFRRTMINEVLEIDAIMELARNPYSKAGLSIIANTFCLDMKNPEQFEEVQALAGNPEAVNMAIMVAMADVLADITVYCRSEALKFGIPKETILDIVMDSNESKLGEDGLPIYDENKKFLKGPNYWQPEPKIRELFERLGVKHGDWE